jgi:hypothetical protein
MAVMVTDLLLRKKFQQPTKIFISLLLDYFSGLWAICFHVALTFTIVQYEEWWPVIL